MSHGCHITNGRGRGRKTFCTTHTMLKGLPRPKGIKLPSWANAHIQPLSSMSWPSQPAIVGVLKQQIASFVAQHRIVSSVLALMALQFIAGASCRVPEEAESHEGSCDDVDVDPPRPPTPIATASTVTVASARIVDDVTTTPTTTTSSTMPTMTPPTVRQTTTISAPMITPQKGPLQRSAPDATGGVCL